MINCLTCLDLGYIIAYRFGEMIGKIPCYNSVCKVKPQGRFMNEHSRDDSRHEQSDRPETAKPRAVNELNVHVFFHADDVVVGLLKQLLGQNKLIMTTQDQLAASLLDLQNTVNGIGTEVDKIGTETTNLQQAVTTLTQELQNQGNTSPATDAALLAVQTSVATLAAKVKAVDDLVPDPADLTPPEAPAPTGGATG